MAEDKQLLQTRETAIFQIESPYPLSSEIEGYERVLPGAAERIFKLVEDESKHRRELEKMALQKESRDSLLGLIFAFIIALATAGIGGALIYLGYPTAGSIFGISGVASIVSAFLRTRTQPEKPKPPPVNTNNENQTP